ncbi:MAG: ABC transporter ATP-binding protein [Polyangiales bacterium]
MTDVAIQAEGVTKWFGEGETRTYAVREVSFKACFQQILYIVGPSGSGKTTLLSIISGILRPDEGRVRVEDTDVWALSENARADFRLNRIGFVFQDFHLFPKLSTVENVAIPLVLQRRDWKDAIQQAHHYLEVVGLSSRAQLNPTRLSGGEQQRVAIARALASSPDLMIFDEPTASLDGDTGKRIVEFVKTEVLNEKRCIIVVTHDSRIYPYADRILHMEDGRLTDERRGGDA